MGVFSGLGDKLKHVFTKLTSRGKLDEYEIKQAMREVRVALLEADVNYTVAKDFIAKVTEKALGELGRLATEKYGTIAREGGGGASIKIKPSCDIPSPDDFLKMLRSDRQKDAERRTTSRGPHRDDFKIEIGGRDAKMYASEGQQRSAVIALKLAQFEMFKKARSVMPVILCDDMLGELDRARREAFWSCVEPSAQVVATSTLEPPENSARGEWKAIFAQSGSFKA